MTYAVIEKVNDGHVLKIVKEGIKFVTKVHVSGRVGIELLDELSGHPLVEFGMEEAKVSEAIELLDECIAKEKFSGRHLVGDKLRRIRNMFNHIITVEN